MGGSSKEPQQPIQPTAQQSAADYNTMLESQWQNQLKYSPLEAAQQVQLAQQYALPYGQAMKTAQEAMYPGTTAIQENLAGQAISGMNQQAPDWMRQEYLSNLRGNLGTNVGSPIAADYASRGLMQMNEDWNRYYQNLGLSVTNRQPLTQAQTPQTTNQMGLINPGQVMGMNQANYGTAAGIYGNQYNAYQQQKAMNSPWAYVQGAGNFLQGVSGGGSGPLGWGKLI